MMFDVFYPRTAHHSRPHVSFARFHSDTPPSSYPTTSVSPAPSNAAQTATGFLFFSEPVPFAAASAPERAGGAPSTDGSAYVAAPPPVTLATHSAALRGSRAGAIATKAERRRETPGHAGSETVNAGVNAPRVARHRAERDDATTRALYALLFAFPRALWTRVDSPKVVL